MNRVFIICLCIISFTGCKKSNDALQQAKTQAVIDDAIVTNYIAANNLNAVRVKIKGSTLDTCGVWYVINSPGPVTTLFTNSSQLTVGYVGRVLQTAKVFAQTGTYHPSFVLGQMIRGWQLGIPAINKGGSVRLLITSRYAYGPYPQDLLGLPANAVLDFDIQLYDVTN